MLRLTLSICLGKLIYFLSRFFKKGGGSAAPGYYALKICPNLIDQLSSQVPTNIIITGTNGKTTTSRLLAHFCQHQNIKVVRNSTGSNLERGIASELIRKSNFLGKVTNTRLGIWETDEAAFSQVTAKLNPKIVVFLNVFRDQLDRYGEVDSVIKNWKETLSNLQDKPLIIINANDANTFSLKEVQGLEYKTFGLREQFIKWEKTNSKEVNLDFEAKGIGIKNLEKTDFDLKYDNQYVKVSLPIPGIYHIYDFLAAFALSFELNLDIKQVIESVKSYIPAFGRVEKIKVGQNNCYIFLIKNPTAATQVFQTILPDINRGDRLLIALNDNFADGKDVSWIWDAEFELLAPILNKLRERTIIVSGTRAQDLAVRLKYAGVNNLISVDNNLTAAFNQAKGNLKGNLFVLPTYTAMLEFQKIFTKQGLKKHYWKES